MFRLSNLRGGKRCFAGAESECSVVLDCGIDGWAQAKRRVEMIGKRRNCMVRGFIELLA